MRLIVPQASSSNRPFENRAAMPEVSGRSGLGYWTMWLAAPVAIVVASAVLRLDRDFVAVALLFAAAVVIRILLAWADREEAKEEQASRNARRLAAGEPSSRLNRSRGSSEHPLDLGQAHPQRRH
jgi:hypothetical protein